MFLEITWDHSLIEKRLNSSDYLDQAEILTEDIERELGHEQSMGVDDKLVFSMLMIEKGKIITQEDVNVFSLNNLPSETSQNEVLPKVIEVRNHYINAEEMALSEGNNNYFILAMVHQGRYDQLLKGYKNGILKLENGIAESIINRLRSLKMVVSYECAALYTEYEVELMELEYKRHSMWNITV